LVSSQTFSPLPQDRRLGESDLGDTTRVTEADSVRDAGIRNHAATRLAWSLWAACLALVALALLLEFLTYDALDSMSIDDWIPGIAVPMGIVSLVYPTIGALIASRLPRNPIGWIFCGVGLLYGTRRFTAAYSEYTLYGNIALPLGNYAGWISSLLEFTGLALAVVFLMLLFPDGRLPSRRWRIVVWAVVLGAALAATSDALAPYSGNPFGVVGVIGGLLTTYELFAASYSLGTTLLLASSLAALYSVILRLRRARGDERQQLKWFLYAAAPAAVGLSVVMFEFVVVRLTTDLLFSTVHLRSPWLWFFEDVHYVSIFALLLLPVCTYIAILRHRLYDIDRLINRTLVYGSLTACVVGIYVLAVGGLAILFQARGNLAVSLLATGVVAVLFQPLRSRLQRGVNRLMYGERDDPYAVISRLGRRLEATIAPETVLPAIAETIAQALKLPYAAILLKEGEGFRTAATYGSATKEHEALPLVYQREEIGRLVIAPRAPGEQFSTGDRRLLEDLARQAEVAVHAVKLTSDLQRSRERLISTREEERRRLRRDLHDGIGPTLTGLALQLHAARKLVRPRPEDAEVTLTRLEQRTEEALSEMRRLIYGLRPPALDDLGLIPSISQLAMSQGMVDPPVGTETDGGRQNGLIFSMEAPDELPTLPAAVEVACYRIAQEAVTNIARHAQARRCEIRLSVEDAPSVLRFEVVDDGIGIAADRVAGVGLSSMRERAEELGGALAVGPAPEGGTLVLARLPLGAPKEHTEGATVSWRAPSVSS
jgi:signal transduction histidine kinase